MNSSAFSESRGFDIDRKSNTIRFERRVDAAPARVFEAWTKPEQVTVWWDPDGEPLLTCEIDLRVGGSFSFVNRGHSDMPFSGVYQEITPPTRLVFEAMGATGRVILKNAEGGTHMVVEIACRSEQHLDEFIKMGVQAGTSRTLDNLVTYVRESVAPAR
jgi:uncharacterized protein YndB with AHSA1/START domain